MNPRPILWILAVFSGINAEERFTVIQKLPSILAVEGQTVLIPCTYTANVSKAIGAYTWYRDDRSGTEVSNGTAEYRGRIFKAKEGASFDTGDASLLIKDVRAYDSGVYHCKVEIIKLGMEYGAGTRLTVRGIKAEKRFTVIQKTPIILAVEGQTVLIPCTYTTNISNVKGGYCWNRDARNGTEVSNGTAEYRGRVYKAREGDSFDTGDASILIKDVRVYDSGVYHCKVVITQLGEEYGAGTRLTVRGIKAEKSFTVIQKLPVILAVEGETVLIPCTYTAKISHSIGAYRWYRDARNGTEVTNGTADYRGRIYRPKERDSFDTGDASILIKDVRANDTGVYHCKVVIMQLGEEYGAGTCLTVRGINAERFTVTQKLPRIMAMEGETVLIPCTYTANFCKSIGVYWWYRDARNGTEISNVTAEYRGRIYRPRRGDSFDTEDASIQIKDVSVYDSGIYYCKVLMMQFGEEYGAGTDLTVRAKKSITVLLSTLLISIGVEVAIILIIVFLCLRLHRMKDREQAQRQEIVVPEIADSAASLTSCLLAGVEDQDLKQEDQSVYTPMESLKTFTQSFDNVMVPHPLGFVFEDGQCSPINSQNEKTESESIQYASILKENFKERPSRNTIVECLDSEHDYGYDELNVTAKRDSKPPGMLVNQEEYGADFDQCPWEVNECKEGDLSGKQSTIVYATVQ